MASVIPFHRIYLHSLVRTAEGAKMSKTKGTGVDPLQLTEQYGTDAMRYMLASMSAPGTDIILSEDRILGARAFANKIWNAARFLFFNLEKIEARGATFEELAAPEVRAGAPYPESNGIVAVTDAWIFSRLNSIAETVKEALEQFRFHEAYAGNLYRSCWDDFCDWYVEWAKYEFEAGDLRTNLPRRIGRTFLRRWKLPCDCFIQLCLSLQKSFGTCFPLNVKARHRSPCSLTPSQKRLGKTSMLNWQCNC